MAAVPEGIDQSKKAEDKLSIRATQAQKKLLRRAAARRHMNMSQFVLQTSLEEAERIVGQDGVLWMTDEQYEWLMAKLDEPIRDLPNLRRLLEEPTVWNG